MKKLLIISLSAGAGHVRAAEAVKKVAQAKYLNLEVEHIDMADHITLPMKKTIIDSYGLMVKRVPELWGFLYDKINSPNGANKFAKITKQLKQMNSLRFRKFVKNYAPDAILCTHFLPADVLLNAPERLRIHAPVNILLTDYDFHSLWFVEGASHYFVATESMRGKMIRSGIPKKQITVSGIPVDPIFYQNKEIGRLKKRYQLPKDKKIILILSGGQGLSKSNQIVKLLFKSSLPLSIIAVAGKNKRLENILKKIPASGGKVPKHIHFLTVGWTENIDEYMRIADIIITKPGGITTTECITLGKPMIIVDPIPGQEECNVAYILSHNLGVIARNQEDILRHIEQGFNYSPAKNLKKSAEIILREIMR